MRTKHAFVAAATLGLAACHGADKPADRAAVCAAETTRQGLLVAILNSESVPRLAEPLLVAFSMRAPKGVNGETLPAMTNDLLNAYELKIGLPVLSGYDPQLKETTCTGDLMLVRRDKRLMPVEAQQNLEADLIHDGLAGVPRRVTYTIQPEAGSTRLIYSLPAANITLLRTLAARDTLELQLAKAQANAALSAKAPETSGETYTSSNGPNEKLGDILEEGRSIRLSITGSAADAAPIDGKVVFSSESDDQVGGSYEFVFDPKDVAIAGESYHIEGVFTFKSGGVHQGTASWGATRKK